MSLCIVLHAQLFLWDHFPEGISRPECVLTEDAGNAATSWESQRCQRVILSAPLHCVGVHLPSSQGQHLVGTSVPAWNVPSIAWLCPGHSRPFEWVRIKAISFLCASFKGPKSSRESWGPVRVPIDVTDACFSSAEAYTRSSVCGRSLALSQTCGVTLDESNPLSGPPIAPGSAEGEEL